MKPKEIQELLDFIASSGLAEVNIETEQFKISVKKNSEITHRTIEVPSTAVHQIAPPVPVVSNPQPAIAPTVAQVVTEPAKTSSTSATSNQITIKSPMIGTFYKSSSPETPSFVNIGDEIKPGQTVCIIEAMKLFNEIEAELSGRIVKILVENATPVEYDQPLFIIEPL
ncbi:MAG: acetyl-CoA carboxylase biotin carboxyl carrier protein [Cytophagales bacterium]|nr:MAG: acetyl-CoA carboxylase biotin carboxyl carrier protein [Cytophagales bacterium]